MQTDDKKKPRLGGARLRRIAREYALLSFFANLTGEIFWWFEQRRWRLADRLENERFAP
jgi:hypothetical protein